MANDVCYRCGHEEVVHIAGAPICIQCFEREVKEQRTRVTPEERSAILDNPSARFKVGLKRFGPRRKFKVIFSSPDRDRAAEFFYAYNIPAFSSLAMFHGNHLIETRINAGSQAQSNPSATDLESLRKHYRDKLARLVTDQAEEEAAKIHGVPRHEAYQIIDSEMESIYNDARKQMGFKTSQEAADWIYGKNPERDYSHETLRSAASLARQGKTKIRSIRTKTGKIVRIAFPPGRRKKGSGVVQGILRPKARRNPPPAGYLLKIYGSKRGMWHHCDKECRDHLHSYVHPFASKPPVFPIKSGWIIGSDKPVTGRKTKIYQTLIQMVTTKRKFIPAKSYCIYGLPDGRILIE